MEKYWKVMTPRRNWNWFQQLLLDRKHPQMTFGLKSHRTRLIVSFTICFFFLLQYFPTFIPLKPFVDSTPWNTFNNLHLIASQSIIISEFSLQCWVWKLLHISHKSLSARHRIICIFPLKFELCEFDIFLAFELTFFDASKKYWVKYDP